MPRFLVVLAASLLAACQSNTNVGPQPSGNVTPTVAGGAQAAFADAASARDAFTRSTEDGMFTAALEDAAWLRYLGTPDEVERAHRAYFVEGYTTFQVHMTSKEFVQPTKETFVLEDSGGRRLLAKPVTYRSAMASGRDGFAYIFSVSFQHAITADTRWLRLTRQVDGASLEWSLN